AYLTSSPADTGTPTKSSPGMLFQGSYYNGSTNWNSFELRTVVSGTTASDYRFSLANTSDTEVLSVDGTGNIHASGNLAINGTGVSSIMGSHGIGTTNVQGALTIENDTWITALNSSGTGHINIFKVNADDQIELGAAL